MEKKKNRVKVNDASLDIYYSGKITQINNLDDNQISIMQSKLEKILLRYKECLGEGADWKTPLGIIITIILVFLTAEFKKLFIFDGLVWEGFFLFVLIASLLWLLRSIINRFKSKCRDIDFLIRQIKGEKL